MLPVTQPETKVAQHLTGSTNGRVEDLIRRAREDTRTTHLSQAKLSRLARAIVNGNRDALPTSLHYMLAWADPTGEDASRNVDHERGFLE